MLTDEQTERLVMMVMASAPDEDHREDDIQKVISWAEGVLIDHGLLENVLDGRMTVRWKDGQCEFGLTPKGRVFVESLPGHSR